MALAYHIAKKALNNDVFCGDAGIVKEFDGKVFLAVIDALGHGEVAHEIAESCIDFLTIHYRHQLSRLLAALHQHIRGTRGAVATLCSIDLEKDILSYVSIGDTLVRKLNNDLHRIYSMPGIIGYEMRTIKMNSMVLTDSDILLLHTDGVKSNFDSEDDDIIKGDVENIAKKVISRYGKEYDDALCIVLRYAK